MRRIIHHLSFAISVIPPMLAAIARRRPDLVIVVVPSMMAAPVVRMLGHLAGAKLWVHVQDFEVGAAIATGLLSSRGWKGWLARRFEAFAYGGFDVLSSISPQMCQRLVAMGYGSDRVFELRNWSNIDDIVPMNPARSPFRDEWAVGERQVALYSGNIANKQGLETIIEAAQILSGRTDILFLICGDGSQKPRLVELAGGLENVQFRELQPRERLNDLLGLASVHLLPQIAGAADLVLPSKLTNMLASGKPVVATADAGTGLEEEVEGCGIVVRPANSRAFAEAVATLVDDARLRESTGACARKRAEERWSKSRILGHLMERVSANILAGRTSSRPGAPAVKKSLAKRPAPAVAWSAATKSTEIAAGRE